MALAALLVSGCVTGSPRPEYMLAANPGPGKQIVGALSGKTVLVGEVARMLQLRNPAPQATSDSTSLATIEFRHPFDEFLRVWLHALKNLAA